MCAGPREEEPRVRLRARVVASAIERAEVCSVATAATQTHLPLSGRSVRVPARQRSNSEAFPLVGSSEPPEFFGHRLQSSMTRATVEDSTAGLGQTLRTGRPLVGGLSLHGVSGLCMNSRAHWLPRWNSSPELGVGFFLRPARHALGGAWCGEQRGPPLKAQRMNWVGVIIS